MSDDEKSRFGVGYFTEEDDSEIKIVTSGTKSREHTLTEKVQKYGKVTGYFKICFKMSLP